jgi:hypothetical protein
MTFFQAGPTLVEVEQGLAEILRIAGFDVHLLGCLQR